MKYVVYTFLLFALIGEPANVSNGQAHTPTTRAKQPNPLNKVLANQDTILMKAKMLLEEEKVVQPKEKVVTKWRTVYRTRIKEVRDTVYVLTLPDSAFYIDTCPPDTVYIEKPVKIKKKNILKRIFK